MARLLKIHCAVMTIVAVAAAPAMHAVQAGAVQAVAWMAKQHTAKHWTGGMSRSVKIVCVSFKHKTLPCSFQTFVTTKNMFLINSGLKK